jgi:hypothetical protein
MKRIKQSPLSGVVIPLIHPSLIVSSAGPRGGPIKSKKKYDRKMQRRLLRKIETESD